MSNRKELDQQPPASTSQSSTSKPTIEHQERGRETEPKIARTSNIFKRLEKTRIFQFFRFIEPFGIALALLAFLLEFTAREDARQVAAWQLLTTRASGNSGKIEALEYLNRPRFFGLVGPPMTSLQGIDLRPPDVTSPRTYLNGVNLRAADLNGANLSNTDITNVDFSWAKLNRTLLINAVGHRPKFEHSRIEFADFSSAVITNVEMKHPDGLFNIGSIKANHARFMYGSMEGTALVVEGEGLFMYDVEVSGAYIRDMNAVEPPLGFVWALPTKPAKFLPPSLIYFECKKVSDVTNRLTRAPEDGTIHGTYPDAVQYEDVKNGSYDFVSTDGNCVRGAVPANPKP